MATRSTANLRQKTKSAYLALHFITQSCQGVMDTHFAKLDPKPTWYDDLASKLVDAQVISADWINNLAPSITGGVPLQVVNYGTTYAAFSSAIQKIAKDHPEAIGKDNKYVIEVHNLVTALEGEITKIVTAAETTAEDLKNWGIKLQKAHDALSEGAGNIQAAETDLQTDIDKMNNAISMLRDTIHKENIAIAASAGGIGLGLFLLVPGIALAPETGGASLVVAASGGLLVVGGAVTWGIMQHKINKQFDEIGKDLKVLAADKAQMVALQGLANGAKQATDYMATASTYLSEFRAEWALFQGEIKAVKDKLELAEESLSVLVASTFSDAALKEWNAATRFAQDIVNTPVQFPKATIDTDGKIINQPEAA